MKKVVALFSAFAVFFAIGIFARADSFSGFSDGRAQIEEAVPDDARGELDGMNIDPENGGVLSVSFSQILKALSDMVKEQAKAPLRLFAALMGVVLLCALSQSIADGGTGNLKSVFSAVGVLAGAGITLTSITGVLRDTLALLSDAASFMLAFIPVFTAVVAVMGHVTSAAAMNASTLAATQLFSQLAVNFLAPLCGSVIGLSAAGAVYPELNLSKLGDMVKKFVTWGLSLLMTVFTALLSAQTFVANAADSAAIRAAKFMVSSGVPIVGGTISDTVNTVQGGLIMLKSSVGTYGIAAAAVIILPTLITAVCYKLAISCAAAAGEMFSLKELSGLLKSCDAAMSIMLAVMSCFLLLSIIAVVIMLSMTNVS